MIAADIDGTLALKGGDLMPKTREMLQELHCQGILFGVATGRPMDRRILAMAEKWGLGFEFDFAIGMNGGDLYNRETGVVEHYFQLKKEDVRTIIGTIADLELNAIVYVNGYDQIRALHMDEFLRDSQQRNKSIVEICDTDFVSEFDTGKIEVHLKPAAMPEFLERTASLKSDRWNMIKTFEGFNHVTIEFIDPHVDKGLALRKFSEVNGIPLSEIMTFGDQDNDIALLEAASWGVCLKNGSDPTKAVAQAVTEYGVEEDGVGRYLETWLVSRSRSDNTKKRRAF